MELNNIKRESSETIDDFLLRLGDNLSTYDLTWTQAAKLLNDECDDEYSESRWRKRYNSYVELKPIILAKYANNEVVQEVRDATVEMQKEKVRFQDQKREYTNVVKQQARFEHLKDEIARSVQELAEVKPLVFREFKFEFSEKTKGIALWSDFHVGSDVKNSINTYNIEVFKLRFTKLIQKTIQHAKFHGITELIVSNLGDAISGLIHVSTRVQSSEDVIKQTQIAAETMAEGLAELSGHFEKIKFINIIGNHSRLLSNKTESIFRENMEYIIPWFLESRLKDFSNIEIVTDEDGIYVEDIEGEKFAFVHGDLDSVNTAAKNLPQILGFVPKTIFSGHIHHNFEKEFGRTEAVVNGTLMGCDDYAISKRYFATPMQKFIVLDGNEIECTYKIKFK
ncbi:hypothetical protein [Paenibacillus sp. FSL E2-0178]|uniref:hypothetical protein n=1 Tax=Paenibacillus sp. FSL E2-0178 TaxID=2921361 RepID=UPI0031581AFB